MNAGLNSSGGKYSSKPSFGMGSGSTGLSSGGMMTSGASKPSFL